MKKFKITYTESLIVGGECIGGGNKTWVEDNLDRYFGIIDFIESVYAPRYDYMEREIYSGDIESVSFPVADGGKKEFTFSRSKGEFIRTIEWEIYAPQNEY